jgi:N-carbamoylputrescine amidase
MSEPKRNTAIGIVQMRCVADPAENLDRAVGSIGEAAGKGAEIICLPELFRSLYFCQAEKHGYFDLAEPIPGPTTDRLGALAKELEIVLVASLFERRAAGVFHNTAVVFDSDGTLMGRYRKMHIPDDPLYYEKFYFTPGDLGFRSWPTKKGNVGVCVCWDQWYPEAARLTALAGADLLFYPTAIGWHPSEKAAFGEAQRDAWITMQRSHAIANGCFVAAANRVGHETPEGGDGIEFFGSSFICDPGGVMLAQADAASEMVLVAAIDTGRIDEQRVHWPFFRDRRIDAYGGLSSRVID